MATDDSGVERSIGRLEGKLDLVIGQMTDLAGAFKTLEAGRLSRLEMQFAELRGKLLVWGAVASLIVSVAVSFISRWLIH